MFFYEEILREFQKKKVKYILVGGVAYNLLGGARSTFDLDILVEMKGPNLLKVIKILLNKGYHVKQPVNPLDFADPRIRKDWIKNKHMKAFNFYKGERNYEEVDIIIESPVNYDKAVKDIVKVKVRDMVLPVISLNKLIEMKKGTARQQDEDDIKNLLILKRVRDEK